MTPHQYHGWSWQVDLFDEPTWPRRETWLTRRMAELQEQASGQTHDDEWKGQIEG